MALTTVGGASILSPEEVGALVIRPLLEQSVAAQVSTVISTNSNSFRVPIVSADPTAGWTAEGAEITASDPTITELDITPKKLAGLTVITNELALDSSPAALSVVGDGLVRDLKRKLDAAFFSSATSNGPSGLLSTASTAVDAGDTWTNLDWAEAAKSAAETAYTSLTAFVSSPATALALASLKELTGSNKTLLSADATSPTSRVIAGVPLYVSPAIADGIVWGIPRQHVLFVIRQDASVVTDTSVFFTSDRVAVRATLRASFGFSYPASIIKIAVTP